MMSLMNAVYHRKVGAGHPADELHNVPRFDSRRRSCWINREDNREPNRDGIKVGGILLEQTFFTHIDCAITN